MKNKLFAVVFILAILVSGLLTVQAGAFGPHHGGGMLHLKALMALDLSNSQKAEVKNIFDTYKDEGKEIRDRVMETKKGVREVMHSVTFDEENARLAFRQLSTNMEDMLVLKARIMVEIKKVLNPDQLNSLEENMQGRMKDMEENMRFRDSMIDTWLQMERE